VQKVRFCRHFPDIQGVQKQTFCTPAFVVSGMERSGFPETQGAHHRGGFRKSLRSFPKQPTTFAHRKKALAFTYNIDFFMTSSTHFFLIVPCIPP
jgi:hypothetical protein